MKNFFTSLISPTLYDFFTQICLQAKWKEIFIHLLIKFDDGCFAEENVIFIIEAVNDILLFYHLNFRRIAKKFSFSWIQILSNFFLLSPHIYSNLTSTKEFLYRTTFIHINLTAIYGKCHVIQIPPLFQSTYKCTSMRQKGNMKISSSAFNLSIFMEKLFVTLTECDKLEFTLTLSRIVSPLKRKLKCLSFDNSHAHTRRYFLGVVKAMNKSCE